MEREIDLPSNIIVQLFLHFAQYVRVRDIVEKCHEINQSEDKTVQTELY